MRTTKLILLTVFITAIHWQMRAQAFNYADALQKSVFFYECQRSGVMPADNRVNWKGNSGLTDGADVSKDLTGGWYDAGDNVKFNFPMAFSATALAWGAIDFKDGYVKANQLAKIKESLRWVNDYFIKCHTAPNELYGQVGSGSADHAFWGAAEVMQMARPSYKIDASKPGTDLAAETAAAMAAASIVFATEDPAYSALLLTHAKQLYNFADTYRGKYSASIPDVTPYYNSWSGYQDELVWGAAWLYRATGDAAYLTKAEAEYKNLANETGMTVKSYKWATAWDDKTYGCYVLLAQLTGKAEYKVDAERHLDYWINGIKYTPGGLAWLDTWGSLRYSSNTAFLALLYSDYITDAAKKIKYFNFAARQINYTLGDNPGKRSFVCGFGVNPPINPHHRTAHGGWSNNLTGEPVNNRHTIYGALVGGPAADDSYTDSRADYTSNEIACDYNACFSGALARLAKDYNSVPSIIAPEVPSNEYYCDAKTNMLGSNFYEPAVFLYNHSSWPATVATQLSIKYFIDITEGIAKGNSINDYSVKLNYAQGGTISPLKPWSGNIYYCEISFPGERVYPGGQSECRREAQFRFYGPAGAWDVANDPSFQGMDGVLKPNYNIAVYNNGILVGGQEPGPGVTYNVVASASAGGAISPSGSIKINKGSNQLFTFTPLTGYKVSSIKVDNVAVTTANNYTLSNITADHTIAVAFVAVPTYTITAGVATGGSISPSGATTISADADQVYTITPNAGFKISSVIIDNVNKGAISTYTFSAIAANHSISASFVAVPVYTVTGSALSNGTISPAGAMSINEGASKTFTITPNAGFKVEDVLVNNISVGAVTTYTLTNISNNTTVKASFVVAPISSLLVQYDVPKSTGLASVNSSYNYLFALGTGGPSMANLTNLTINWDAPNNGLWQFSMSTNNGTPSWYNDLLPKLTQNFKSPSPAMKITGSGIQGLDGDYWVNMDGANLVLVVKSGNYAIYCSTTSTPPANLIKTLIITKGDNVFEATVSPNPSAVNGTFVVQFNALHTGSLAIYDAQGVERLTHSFEEQEIITIQPTDLAAGIYFIRISVDGKVLTKKIVVR